MFYIVFLVELSSWMPDYKECPLIVWKYQVSRGRASYECFFLGLIKWQTDRRMNAHSIKIRSNWKLFSKEGYERFQNIVRLRLFWLGPIAHAFPCSFQWIHVGSFGPFLAKTLSHPLSPGPKKIWIVRQRTFKNSKWKCKNWDSTVIKMFTNYRKKSSFCHRLLVSLIDFPAFVIDFLFLSHNFCFCVLISFDISHQVWGSLGLVENLLMQSF